ncbi:MAG: hypothetical protein JNM24_03795 [Bdellovibrionaceae bacterium]|nr:hypothetical protein [Pseudobdellovibrionaceae bacterium]
MKKFLYLSLISTVLILPVSPNAISSEIQTKANGCASFYQNTIEPQFILPLLKKVKFFETKSPHGTHLMVVDLAQVSPSSRIQQIVSSYFNYVRSVYQERLKKFEGNPSAPADRQQEFIDHSLALRSVLVLDTPNDMDPQSPTFNGGVRVTYARSTYEKLPLQYEFPNFHRYNLAGTAAEIGRLTAQPGSPPGLSIHLIKLATQVALQDPNVTDIYVHTSKTHARLYRLMGLRPRNVDIKDELNYVLRFTTQDALNWLTHVKPH